MRSNARRSHRKRNRSTPTHNSHSNTNLIKKQKQPADSESRSGSEIWSDIEVDVDADDSVNIPETVSSVSTCPVPTCVSSTPAPSPAPSTPVPMANLPQSVLELPSGSAVPVDNNASVINTPVHNPQHLSIDGGASASFASQQHVLAYPPSFTPQHLPTMPMSVPVPVTAPISLTDADVTRIAMQMKTILRDEIQQLVAIEVRKSTEQLYADIQQLKKTNDSLATTVQELQLKIDDLEQYSRRSCVRISGVSETDSENVNAIVMDLANRIHADVTPRDIDRTHRVGAKFDRNRNNGNRRKDRDIIVKFTNSSARLEFLKGRKVLREQKAKVFINEDLTSSRMELAFECRELKRSNLSRVVKTWTYNGNVFVQDKDGKKTKILSKSDLDGLRQPSVAV